VKLFVDECFAKSIVVGLAARGHDVVWAKDVCRGAEDLVVLARATEAERVLITEDRDFSQLVFLDRISAYGVVNFYANRFDLSLDDTVAKLCDQVDHLGETLVGYITVIEPGRVRRRPLRSAS
jgi:NAD(P)-dependent dehydrogenase (short-subunit alcohol dehydrogenase family)